MLPVLCADCVLLNFTDRRAMIKVMMNTRIITATIAHRDHIKVANIVTNDPRGFNAPTMKNALIKKDKIQTITIDS